MAAKKRVTEGHPERRRRVLSGMRPTGRLHLGHLVGALENWVRLQDQYQCFFFVADWHALTTDYADTRALTDNTIQMVTDWLAAGLDPQKATLFLQSHVPEHAELHLLFSMVTPLGWLERVPSYKEQREQIRDRDLGTYGFLGYPVLQAADILIYKAQYVPVGEDQVAHVELTREIARRFNQFFMAPPSRELFKTKHRDRLNQLLRLATDSRLQIAPTHRLSSKEVVELSDLLFSELPNVLENVGGQGDSLPYHKVLWPFLAEMGVAQYFGVFLEPQVLLTQTPKLPGLDGRKMSKSYGNTIELADTPDTIRQKVSTMLTDPQRVRRTDPGRPEICPVFGLHRLYSPPDVIAQVDRDCRTAQIGCVDCKGLMAQHLITALEPIRDRRRAFEARPESVWEILKEGSKKASRVARATLRRVRDAMNMTYEWERKRKPKPAGKPASTPSVTSD
ncbi:MAG: tryptophan--tRNA ligase [Acidobacteria bacterium]|nr:tryptophan--tRNA ligase [Acidobacteriota bacterium]